MSMSDCYVGMGGNFDQTFSIMKQAVQQLSAIEKTSDFTVSPIYRTTPVSNVEQPSYLNAVCRFFYPLSLEKLWKRMQEIERKLGKEVKPKNAPRLIDLDLLFFGSKVYHSPMLTLPHPRWHERLFVLAPLADITDTTPLGINVKEMVKKFLNPHNEQVVVCGTLT